MCVSVYLAFVTKHPRCQRDTAGWQRKGRGPEQEVSLHCVPVQTVALRFRLSHSGNLQQARRKNLALFTRERGLVGGWRGEARDVLCARDAQKPSDYWEVMGEEDEGAEG